MDIWLVPSCALGGVVVGWFAAPLAERYFERPVRWARPGVSLTMAVTFGLLAWRLGGRAELPAFLYLAAVGALLASVDVAVKRLPDPYTLPSYLIGPALLGVAVLTDGRPVRLVHALVGLAVLWALYAVQHLFAPGAIGWGDVKLSGVLGLYLGWLGLAAWWLGVLAGFVLGGLYAAALLITRRGSRKTEIPFGPFMLAGALAGILLS
ncbi:prepilin peptidase [Actinoallomurus iriomotensis]|uniref:Prepilin peptidase n=1 Tax=Actinoallomurus iriomotensis TaxID=478107 RepID=A0A9W6VYJ8_9ACTN|nr:A24 family peptidase [Actinoallomurus iriomotensis]GLY84384.1 prepilin peptidase [Actinoallomurus iriomotensis]